MVRINHGLKALACFGLLTIVTGCAGNPFGDANVLPLNNAFRAGEVVPVNSHVPVRLSVVAFTDERTALAGREIGTMEKDAVVYGINGSQLFSDDTVSQIISAAMRSQFVAGGYRLVDVSDADFQVTGVIRDYRINIGARDNVSMVVAVNLLNADNRALVWSGEASLQDERFAGVGGNSSKTITTFLAASLQALTVKTYNAVTTALMRSHADLFVDPNAVPTIGAAVGIKTLAQPTPAALPVQLPVVTSKSSSAELAVGRLAVTTTPDRAGTYIDDIYFGLTPIEIELAPGIHTLRVVRDGYQAVEQKVSVRKAVTTELPLVLVR